VAAICAAVSRPSKPPLSPAEFVQHLSAAAAASQSERLQLGLWTAVQGVDYGLEEDWVSTTYAHTPPGVPHLTCCMSSSTATAMEIQGIQHDKGIGAMVRKLLCVQISGNNDAADGSGEDQDGNGAFWAVRHFSSDCVTKTSAASWAYVAMAKPASFGPSGLGGRQAQRLRHASNSIRQIR